MGNINITVNNLEQGEFLQLCKVLQDTLSVNIILDAGNQDDVSIQNRIIMILTKLGINTKLKGYQYLKTAIEDCYEHDGDLNSVTKYLYPKIAKKHNTTSSRVEHAIRSALEKSWPTGNKNLQKEIFGHIFLGEGGKPSNSSFIATVTDYLMLHENIELIS